MATEANVTKHDADLSQDVSRRLEDLGPDLAGHQVLLLPTEMREGVTYYKPEEVNSGRMARQVFLDAAYLDAGQDRRFLHEYSAGWVLDFALAVGQNLSADGLIAIGRYILARAGYAISNKRHDGPLEAVPTRVTIGRVDRKSDGTVVVRNVCFEGHSEGVSMAVKEFLQPLLGSSLPRSLAIEGDIDGGGQEKDRSDGVSP
ncbi:hypothetical protein [Planotetraspora mira]|uniref:Uncharacterized protein n=1 Tax=Planotetraspora mira TaxID=58121 RepID=A0A8J3X8Y1_9ACTN|nr:hypothetical protein [Planotetraspora mira]GII32300.1 hypothetical protein Pmi06nite_57420 [Planotetraspora mira]